MSSVSVFFCGMNFIYLMVFFKRRRELANKVNDICFKKTNISPNGQIKFDSDLLNLYLAVEEKKNMLSLYKESKLEPAVFKTCLIKLIKLNLIEQAKNDLKEKKFLNGSFFSRLREVLVELSGPLGELLIEEAAETLNFETSKIPLSKATDFIYHIADSIPSEKQAIAFKNIMNREILEHHLIQE